ncbi:outer membrane protein [Bradyrhizobium liaoningense]|uniref:outer membrane protein n=1 Tax=Bradyrhizobium liaoningense TaxID=43992 RepID=UPI001BABE81B|nr:autotransporter domain-containing protein [Bradyrhizobium liaoningense]MBR0715476.1 autotransporter domain-containing protein [Bradyrhizobium liaoningense]
MKKLVIVLAAVAAGSGAATAADLAAKTYVKAPALAPSANWTGFYVFGGAGGGLWNADSNAVTSPGGLALTRDQRLGGTGWFGTVGLGYDWQVTPTWVAGVFADGQFGDIHGSIADPARFTEGTEKLRTSYAAGVRLGTLVAPNVLSYVNAGYSGSEWSGSTFMGLPPGGGGFATFTTLSFRRSGWFVGGGVENSLNIFGVAAPGWFMKTEYRSAYYDRATLPETFTPAFGGAPTGNAATFKPWVQTVSTSLVYRFNDMGTAAAAGSPTHLYAKAPSLAAGPNWTGFHVFGGGGGGIWNADSGVVNPPIGVVVRDQRLGGNGWFGTVGLGYDRQFNSTWVAGVFADAQFGNLKGSISDPNFIGRITEGQERLRTSYAAGVRLGYLVAPNVLSYVNAGYSGSDWSGASHSSLENAIGLVDVVTTPSFHRNGWFVGGGVENSLNILGVSAPGWFMKTEYRSAFYDRVELPASFGPAFGGGPTGDVVTFKPWVQTISTSLVYRFNSTSPVVAKY